jgi:3-hydroxyisobutyrate dehydrogenase-like beta-hydroxyacid dehydrogenase
MARNIAVKAKLDKPLIVYNRTAKRSEEFRSSLEDPSLLEIADTVENAVQNADIVFTSLGDDASVVSIIERALQVVGGVKGKLFVDTSTILPKTTNEIAKMVNDAGADFVAAPGKHSRVVSSRMHF